jgi:hypothetical protein
MREATHTKWFLQHPTLDLSRCAFFGFLKYQIMLSSPNRKGSAEVAIATDHATGEEEGTEKRHEEGEQEQTREGGGGRAEAGGPAGGAVCAGGGGESPPAPGKRFAFSGYFALNFSDI